MRADLPSTTPTALTTVATGSSHGPKHPAPPNTPGLYADPAAWSVVQAVKDMLERAQDPLGEPTADVGVIVCSERVTWETLRTVGDQALTGRVRPRMFAAANPGSLAGLPCIVLGFRGPTLTLAVSADRGRDAAEAIAATWLSQRLCRLIVLAEHSMPHPGAHATHCRLVSGGGSHPPTP